jgi:ribosomal protein S8
MIARFPCTISTLRAHNKMASNFCDTPTNSLGIRTLRLFRAHGLIQGFSFVSPKKQSRRLYPRVRIFFKRTETNFPAINNIKLYKNTRSNFVHFHYKRRFNANCQRTLYLLTSPRGLRLMSLRQLLRPDRLTRQQRFAGKILLEVSF